MKLKERENEFNHQLASEKKIDFNKVSSFEKHWEFDLDNRIQKRIYPKKTILSMEEAFDFI